MRSYLIIFVFLLVSCSGGGPASSAQQRSGAGIYYWRTAWQPAPAEQQDLIAAGARQLFLRLFDVDWDFNQQQAHPKGMLRVPDSLYLDPALTVTPVVFIAERVFRQEVDVADLARRVGRTIKGLTGAQPAFGTITRWQIDCDWTPASRDRYFTFLRVLQQQQPAITLNVTVRLHQYREREQNGIPPVTEGLLMCYNMEPVDQPKTVNAIYREDLLTGYLKAPPYPLVLDVALPVFAWGAAFREGRFLGITPRPTVVPGYLEQAGQQHYLVTSDTTLGNTFVRPGDIIRSDGPLNTAQLAKAAGLLTSKPAIRDLLLFDWNSDAFREYDVSNIWSAYY